MDKKIIEQGIMSIGVDGRVYKRLMHLGYSKEPNKFIDEINRDLQTCEIVGEVVGRVMSDGVEALTYNYKGFKYTDSFSGYKKEQYDYFITIQEIEDSDGYIEKVLITLT